jgi:hypothetical protein
LVAESPKLSAAFTVKLNVPAAVAAPLIAPLEELRARPLGKEPEERL